MALPIQEFIETKIREYDEDFDMRDGTAFNSMFIKPSTLIIQPFRDELDQIEQNQSVKSMLEGDTNSFPEDSVDALMSNVFVDRQTGEKVTGVVRAYFLEARAIDILAEEARFLDDAGNYFINTGDISITSRQMAIQTSGDYFYVDIPVESEEEGAITVNVNGIVSWENSPSGLVQVGNEDAFTAGADKETNLEYINRAKQSISVRDLVTGKGIVATLNENFSNIEDIESIGFGDPEMQRDIVFNTHIGGHVDIYIKTPQVQSADFDAFALLTDPTRQRALRTFKTLTGEDWVSFGIISIDRTNGDPVVNQIADDTFATFTSTVDLTGGVNLSTVYNIKISAIDPNESLVTIQIGIQGAVPSATTRSEIINKVNTAMGFTLCAEEAGGGGEEYIKFTSPIAGTSGYFSFIAPSAADATNEVFGLNEAIYPHSYIGSTAITYVEGIDYEFDDDDGLIRRINTGSIGDGDLVEISLEYNPISIDIGIPVRNVSGDIVSYSIRTGREDTTIQNLPFIDITSIEELDPVSGEPNGNVLDGIGGFGQGGFGRGNFGVGFGADYELVVLEPHARYSIREENYIEFIPNFVGKDVRISYRYAPEIEDIQEFVETPAERVVTSKTLVKHFIPAFVDVEMSYEVPASDVTAKTNDELIELVAEAINDIPRGNSLQASDLVNLLYENGATKVDLPISMLMEIHHVNGTNEIKTDEDSLTIPSPTLESETDMPISESIAHFLPRNILLTRRTV